MTNAIDTRTAGQKAADTRRANLARALGRPVAETNWDVAADAVKSALMVEAGRKAHATREARARQDVELELGLAPCKVCGKDTKIARTQTQGMKIMHAACAVETGEASGINFAKATIMKGSKTIPTGAKFSIESWVPTRTATGDWLETHWNGERLWLDPYRYELADGLDVSACAPTVGV